MLQGFVVQIMNNIVVNHTGVACGHVSGGSCNVRSDNDVAHFQEGMVCRKMFVPEYVQSGAGDFFVFRLIPEEQVMSV